MFGSELRVDIKGGGGGGEVSILRCMRAGSSSLARSLGAQGKEREGKERLYMYEKRILICPQVFGGETKPPPPPSPPGKVGVS